MEKNTFPNLLLKQNETSNDADENQASSENHLSGHVMEMTIYGDTSSVYGFGNLDSMIGDCNSSWRCSLFYVKAAPGAKIYTPAMVCYMDILDRYAATYSIMLFIQDLGLSRLVEMYGGNCNNILLTSDNWFRQSAKAVLNLASQLQKSYPRLWMTSVKAILINSRAGRLTNSLSCDEWVDAEWSLTSTGKRVTYIIQDEVEDECERTFVISLPDYLTDVGVSATLCYSFIPSLSPLESYNTLIVGMNLMKGNRDGLPVEYTMERAGNVRRGRCRLTGEYITHYNGKLQIEVSSSDTRRDEPSPYTDNRHPFSIAITIEDLSSHPDADAYNLYLEMNKINTTTTLRYNGEDSESSAINQ